MALGPVELLVLKFPGNKFRGEIAPALQDLVDSRMIRVIDILFAIKEGNDPARLIEINEMETEDYDILDPIVSDITGLLSEDDVEKLTASLEPNSSALLILFENTWAAEFATAAARAGAQVVINERIPRAVVEEVLAAREADAAAVAG